MILQALQEVYKANDEQQTMMPSTPARKELLRQKPGAKDLFTSAAPFQGDADLGERARERLHLWQVEYASGLVESGLADWLRGRPLLAVVGDALVLHGGIPLALLQRVAEQQRLQLELAGGEADGAAALGDLAAALDAASNQAFARVRTQGISTTTYLVPGCVSERRFACDVRAGAASGATARSLGLSRPTLSSTASIPRRYSAATRCATATI